MEMDADGENDDRIKGAAYMILQDRLCYSGGKKLGYLRFTIIYYLDKQSLSIPNIKRGKILNRLSCLQKDGSWNDQRKLRNARMYHLMASHPCSKYPDHVMVCGGYDKSWKHQTNCEIIDEDGKDKNLGSALLRRDFK